jgi:hypothetical protein
MYTLAAAWGLPPVRVLRRVRCKVTAGLLSARDYR